MKMNKKGVIEQLQALIIPLIAIAIILVVGFLIIQEGKDQVIERTAVGTATINESLTNLQNNTLTALSNQGNCMTLSCDSLYNASGPEGATPTTDYTCGLKGINTTNATAEINGSMVVSYTCTNKTVAFNATGTTQNAIQDIPGWLPIIVITIIGALLIGLVSKFRRQ